MGKKKYALIFDEDGAVIELREISDSSLGKAIRDSSATDLLKKLARELTVKILSREPSHEAQFALASIIGWAFKESGDERALEILVPLLSHKDWEVRWSAVHVIGQIFKSTGNLAVLDVLIPVLRDEDPDVRLEVARVLGRIFRNHKNAKRAMLKLKKLMKEGDQELKTVIAHALGRMFQDTGDPDVIAELVEEWSKSEDSQIRSALLEALWRISRSMQQFMEILASLMSERVSRAEEESIEVQ